MCNTAGLAITLLMLAMPLAHSTGDPFTGVLQDRFASPMPMCQGWGSWQAPLVMANRGDAEARYQGITVPPRGVIAHPGPDRQAAVGWRSPLAGAVRVQARVADAHPQGGDGVTWTLAHVGPAGTTILASGVIGRGGAQAVPDPATGALTNVPVRPGEGLLLAIGPRGNYQCDSTLIELTITEIQGEQRVWDLSKDVAGDIQAGNPHADTFGNAAVWHFLALPPGTLAAAALDARQAAGERVGAWTVATDDTRITVGATREGQLCLYEISAPAAGWNWTAEPSVFGLVRRAIVGGVATELRWQFLDAVESQADGQQVTLRFTCDDPALELASTWRARPGRGPVWHTMAITNRGQVPVTLAEQPTVDLEVASPPEAGTPAMWTFHTDGRTPDATGVYRQAMAAPFFREVRTHPDGEFIPYAVFDAAGKQGIYVGIAWSYCRIAAAAPAGRPTGVLRVHGGEFDDFTVAVAPGETFAVPPGFIGAYRGDVDDAGNSLRRHLFAYVMPEVVRADPSYPKVQWNAFGASGDRPGGWNSVEAKYYPLVDGMAALGFEEVMLDVGWWKGSTSAPEPVADPADWPSGMRKAADYAHAAGIRFGLYWNKGEAMATAEGRNRRRAHIKRLYDEHGADMWRSDSTGGPVVGASYAEVKGFYAMLDQLARELPGFQWENCVCGGRVKDFGAMARAVKVFSTDTYAEHHVRQAFYDGSYAFPPAQLMGCLGSTDGRYRPRGAAAMRFAFRTMSLGAPEWFIDGPAGLNGGGPWTDEEKAAVAGAVALYKARIRPLVRHGDLYHILPRPDGKRWDGMQYYDPATRVGVVYLFKPAPGVDTLPIKLRGLDPAVRYRVTFTDGSNPTVEQRGEELLGGLNVTLTGAPVSELIFLEAVE